MKSYLLIQAMRSSSKPSSYRDSYYFIIPHEHRKKYVWENFPDSNIKKNIHGFKTKTEQKEKHNNKQFWQNLKRIDFTNHWSMKNIFPKGILSLLQEKKFRDE